jgi:cytochrome b
MHWYLLLAVTVMWWSGEQGRMDIHQWVGSSLLCVVAVRVIWGFIGSEPARFTHFLAPPLVVWRYLRRGGEYAGHNPLGGWSVMAMLFVLLVQSASGLFSRDDLLFEGPFSYWASEISGTGDGVALDKLAGPAGIDSVTPIGGCLVSVAKAATVDPGDVVWQSRV